jgi:glutathione S-transferase
LLPVLEAELTSSYFAGEELSVADIAIWNELAGVFGVIEAQIQADHTPRLSTWFE